MPSERYDTRSIADQDIERYLNGSTSTSLSLARRSSSTPLPTASRQRTPDNAGNALVRNYSRLQKRLYSAFKRLTPFQRVLSLVAFVTIVVLIAVTLVYGERIFSLLTPFAQKWRQLPGGFLIIWLLTFVVSFPPLLGYSSCLTAAGFVYGFPNG